MAQGDPMTNARVVWRVPADLAEQGWKAMHEWMRRAYPCGDPGVLGGRCLLMKGHCRRHIYDWNTDD